MGPEVGTCAIKEVVVPAQPVSVTSATNATNALLDRNLVRRIPLLTGHLAAIVGSPDHHG